MKMIRVSGSEESLAIFTMLDPRKSIFIKIDRKCIKFNNVKIGRKIKNEKSVYASFKH